MRSRLPVHRSVVILFYDDDRTKKSACESYSERQTRIACIINLATWVFTAVKRINIMRGVRGAVTSDA